MNIQFLCSVLLWTAMAFGSGNMEIIDILPTPSAGQVNDGNKTVDPSEVVVLDRNLVSLTGDDPAVLLEPASTAPPASSDSIDSVTVPVLLTGDGTVDYADLIDLPSNSDGLSITSSVEKITPGLTDRATIRCSYSKQDNSNVLMVLSLILKQFDNASDTYQDMLVINKGHHHLMRFNYNNDVSDGALVNDGESFLSISWNYPGRDVATKYICIVHTLEATGYTKDISVGTEINLQHPTLRNLIQSLREVKDHQRILNEAFEEEHNVTTDISNMEIFSEPVWYDDSNNEFTNSRVVIDNFIIYWTVKETFNFHEAKIVCSNVGGKPFDFDFHKLQAVKPKLQEAGMADREYWIGLMKLAGKWVYASSGRPWNQTAWQANEEQDCASFRFSGTKGFDPDPCREEKSALCVRHI